MNAAGQRRLTPVLMLALAALGGLWQALLGGWGSEPRWSTVAAATPAPAADRAAPLPPPAPRSQFAVIWQRPLFSPDRRPAAQALQGSSIGELQLTGVILTPTLQLALLHDRQGDRELRLHRGESAPGGQVTLVEVRPRSAVFDTPNGRVELHLPAGAPIDANAPPAAPDAAPAKPAATPATDAPAAGRAPDQTQAQRIRALRQIIQKRRAAQAAAVHEGDH
jgi:general secretion pathway protein N